MLWDRAKITSHFLAGPFGRWQRCSLLTDPLAGYARRSRLASDQNSCAVKYEFIFAWGLTDRAKPGRGKMRIYFCVEADDRGDCPPCNWAATIYEHDGLAWLGGGST